jgi:hypothetical protein
MGDLNSIQNVHSLFNRMYFIAIEVGGPLLELGKIFPLIAGCALNREFAG